MGSADIKILADKVERLADDLIKTHNENAKLKRMLDTAEVKIKKLSRVGGAGGDGILPLNRQVEKMKNERRIIKAKVEKMVNKLSKFYGV